MSNGSCWLGLLDLDKLFFFEETKCPVFRSHPSLLARYTDIFVRHEIDLPTFATLTDEELKEVGTGHLDFMASLCRDILT